MEDALIEVPTMTRCAVIDLICERIPDETTILDIRHLLEKHDLGQQIFETVEVHLKARGMAMNNQWYHRCALGFAYEMKVHNGVFAASGLIHSVQISSANVHDLTPAPELLHGEETLVYADAGYQGNYKRQEM